jgi:hypothetical protein
MKDEKRRAINVVSDENTAYGEDEMSGRASNSSFILHPSSFSSILHPFLQATSFISGSKYVTVLSMLRSSR